MLRTQKGNSIINGFVFTVSEDGPLIVSKGSKRYMSAIVSRSHLNTPSGLARRSAS
jgi:hypothetical protein